MHKVILTVLFACVLWTNGKSQDDSTTKAHQLIRLEQALADALPNDSVFWRKYLDPQWYIVTEDGSGFNKSDFLRTFAPFPKEISGYIKIIHPVFSFHDNFAVINYVADEYETAYGQSLHTTYGTSDTWYKTDTSWMMLSMQDFEIPQVPPAIKVDSQILEQYVGTYQLTDQKLAIVTVKNDTLFIQKDKSQPVALYPETPNIFFRRSDARGRKFFVRDDTGQMIMRERRNGEDLVWKRVK
jgi:hypothetical protein